jgi:hypothetical protein
MSLVRKGLRQSEAGRGGQRRTQGDAGGTWLPTAGPTIRPFQDSDTLPILTPSRTPPPQRSGHKSRDWTRRVLFRDRSIQGDCREASRKYSPLPPLPTLHEARWFGYPGRRLRQTTGRHREISNGRSIESSTNAAPRPTRHADRQRLGEHIANNDSDHPPTRHTRRIADAAAVRAFNAVVAPGHRRNPNRPGLAQLKRPN